MKTFFIIIVSAIVAGAVKSQTYSYCTGDTITLCLNTYRGNLQWQQSTDSIDWYDLPGANYQPYKMVFNVLTAGKYHRAKITEGTCNPVYSQISRSALSASCGPFVCGTSIVADIDSNYYNTVQIGNQCCLKENLNTSRYRDGTAIQNVTGNGTWGGLSTGAFCWYNNDSVLYDNVYGKLYNWYAVNDSRKLAPAGWHVATDSEWNIMEIYLDTTVDTTATGWVGTDIGGKLKETGTMHWNSPNTGATNSSGYSALPGGLRISYGTFYDIADLGYWWSASEYDATYAWFRNLYFSYSQVYRK
ncbi:MAG: fibrobacter succinogenes major paralogous domain-containing protein [Bacteroidia bacterium]|nr:fibrobacter succinogenes major paralogous domain-containing protein [Bacteroidia bacterium]